MGASSGLTPTMGVVEQAMFYGVDGDCRACPGVSLSRKGTEKIEDCECPVSPRLRALPHTHTPVRIICTQRDRVNFSRIAPPPKPSVVGCNSHELWPPSPLLPRSTTLSHCSCPVIPSSPCSPARP